MQKEMIEKCKLLFLHLKMLNFVEKNDLIKVNIIRRYVSMRRNKMAKTGIILAILLLTVAFAVISTNLAINGTASIKSNNDEFEQNIKFSTEEATKPYLMVNGTKSETNIPIVSPDGKTITFTTPEFDTIGNNAVLHYWITNESTNYNATLGELTCTKTLEGATGEEEYISVTPKNAFDGTTLAKGNTTATDDSVEIKMIRSYAKDGTATYKINCTITATGTEN